MKVWIDREKLLGTLRKNRESHRAIFEEAVEGYKKKALDELESKLEAVRSMKRKPIQVYLSLPLPVDHTDEYDRAIKMISMSESESFELDEEDFSNFVEDDWGWKNNFLTSNSFYSVSAQTALGQ